MRDFEPGPFARALMGLSDLLSIPMMALNFLAPVVGGIWLLILGKWSLVGAGIAVFVLADFILGMVSAPMILLGGRGRQPYSMWLSPGEVVRAVLAHGYMAVVVIAWGLGSFLFVSDQAGDAAIWPFWLWAYEIAATPWDRAVLLAVRQKMDPPSFLAMLNKLGLWGLVGFSFVSIPLAVAVYVGAVVVGVTAEFVGGVLSVEARMRARYF